MEMRNLRRHEQQFLFRLPPAKVRSLRCRPARKSRGLVRGVRQYRKGAENPLLFALVVPKTTPG